MNTLKQKQSVEKSAKKNKIDPQTRRVPDEFDYGPKDSQHQKKIQQEQRQPQHDKAPGNGFQDRSRVAEDNKSQPGKQPHRR